MKTYWISQAAFKGEVSYKNIVLYKNPQRSSDVEVTLVPVKGQSNEPMEMANCRGPDLVYWSGRN